MLLNPEGASATLLRKGEQVKPIAGKDIAAMLKILTRSQDGMERVWGAMHSALQREKSEAARSRWIPESQSRLTYSLHTQPLCAYLVSAVYNNSMEWGGHIAVQATHLYSLEYLSLHCDLR